MMTNVITNSFLASLYPIASDLRPKTVMIMLALCQIIIPKKKGQRTSKKYVIYSMTLELL